MAMETMAARMHIRIIRPTTLEVLSLIIFDSSSLCKMTELNVSIKPDRSSLRNTRNLYQPYLLTAAGSEPGRTTSFSIFFSFFRAVVEALPTKLKKRMAAGIS
jgi:hypothetical protein